MTTNSNILPPLIYVSGPYTKGDVAENVCRAMAVAHYILDCGGVPIVPHLSHYLHIHRQRPYDDWLAMDLALIQCTNLAAIYRIPGESPGAEREIGLGRVLSIPIIFERPKLGRFIRGWLRERRSDQ